MGVFSWKFKHGEWLCYLDDAVAFKVPEDEMYEMILEKGTVDAAKKRFEDLYGARRKRA